VNKQFCPADACERNDRKFGGNTAGFFTMTTHPLRRCCPSRSFSLKTKLQWLDSHPTTVISLQQTFFPVAEMGSQFKRLSTGINAVHARKIAAEFNPHFFKILYGNLRKMATSLHLLY
jgi:hypothetical protein